MMFDIEFNALSMRAPQGKKLEDLGAASEMNLRYGYFQTDVDLTARGFGVERLHGITIIDFVFCLILAAREVRESGIGEVGFTENDQTIKFTRDGEVILIERSWDPEVGSCDEESFFVVALRFCGDVLKFIDKEYPAFLGNSTRAKIVGMLSEFSQ